jgi:hypothetical protein
MKNYAFQTIRLGLILLSLGGLVAHANPTPILIQSADLPDEDFKAALEANRDQRSFAEAWPDWGVSTDLRRELQNSFARAQRAFLESELQAMHAEWEKVYDFAYKADWSTIDREMIAIAMLRLAQLSPSSEETDRWLRRTLEFDEHFEPKADLFPPPLVERLHSLRKKLAKVSVTWREELGFELVYINGVPHPLRASLPLLLPDATVRATFVSAKFTPVTRVMLARDLSQFRPARNWLVGGTCEKPKIHWGPLAEQPPKDAALVFSGLCLAPLNGAAASLEKPNETPLALAPDLERGKNRVKADHTWLWLGVGIFLGYAALSGLNHESHSGPPPVTEGF